MPSSSDLQSVQYRLDINYGVPYHLNDPSSLQYNLQQCKGKSYDQKKRNIFSIKIPGEFFPGEYDPIIVPPTGVSCEDIQQRIYHLQYIQSKLSEENERINNNIQFYTDILQEAQDSGIFAHQQVFSTPHHTVIVLSNRILFEIRECYLTRQGVFHNKKPKDVATLFQEKVLPFINPSNPLILNFRNNETKEQRNDKVM